MKQLFKDDWVTITMKKCKRHPDTLCGDAIFVFSDGKKFTADILSALRTSEDDHEWIMQNLDKISSMHGSKYGYYFDDMLREVYVEGVLSDTEARKLFDDEWLWDHFEDIKKEEQEWKAKRSQEQF